MSAKITQRDRETAIRITRAHKAPAHLVKEWKTRESETPLRPFLAELFQPLQDAAQALADAREAGYRQATKDAQAYLQFGCGLPQTADDLEGLAHLGAAEKYAEERYQDSLEREPL